MSLNTTKACPLIRSVFRATMSRIGPNWEKMAYRDFFSSGREETLRMAYKFKWLPLLTHQPLGYFI